MGPAVVWCPGKQPLERRFIPPSKAPEELGRFRHTLRRAQRELEQVAARVAVTIGESPPRSSPHPYWERGSRFRPRDRSP
jgi:hypothetical protein